MYFMAFDLEGNVKPFVLYTVTDADEAMDIGNRGFALAYTQNACPLVIQWKTTASFLFDDFPDFVAVAVVIPLA